VKALLVFLAVCSLATQAIAAAPKQLGRHKAWSSWALMAPSGRECFAHSVPSKSEGNYNKRGSVSVSVTHRPGDRVVNELAFSTGYTLKKKSEVVVVIDGRSFRLFVDGETAYARDPSADATIVDAMIKGSRMRVEGVSSRGTKTVDSYSLSGFSSAYRSITKSCQVK
jgi:hypothetical protein